MNDHAVVKKGAKHAPDYILMISVLVLVFLGLLMIYSASYFRAATYEDDGNYYFSRQLILAVVGAIVALLICYFFNYRIFKERAWLRYAAAVFAVVVPLLVFMPGLGITVNGASRWIMVAGVSIQPSELSKLALIVFISGEIGAHPEKIKDFFKGVLPILGLLGMLCVILFLMPNASAVICISLLVFAMLVVGGVSKNFLIGVAIFGVVAILALVALEPYRVNRFIAMFDPFSDTTTEAYQLRNSLYSVSSGGLFGRGLGQSVQKLMYLPLPESDFIFAIICEELGFVGAMFTLSMFSVVIWRGVLIALRAPDLTGTLMATGVVAIIAIQVVVNVGVVLGVLPSTGVVLPFISYGGSAIISFLAMIGLLLNVSRQTVRAVKVHQSAYEKRERELAAAQPQPALQMEAQREGERRREGAQLRENHGSRERGRQEYSRRERRDYEMTKRMPTAKSPQKTGSSRSYGAQNIPQRERRY